MSRNGRDRVRAGFEVRSIERPSVHALQRRKAKRALNVPPKGLLDDHSCEGQGPLAGHEKTLRVRALGNQLPNQTVGANQLRRQGPPGCPHCIARATERLIGRSEIRRPMRYERANHRENPTLQSGSRRTPRPTPEHPPPSAHFHDAGRRHRSRWRHADDGPKACRQRVRAPRCDAHADDATRPVEGP